MVGALLHARAADGISVIGATGTPSTVPLTVLSLHCTTQSTSQKRGRMGLGGWGNGESVESIQRLK